jgi:glycosyltransferase involved in cell wall biosynthesis
MLPLVSVVVPAYNEEEVIPECHRRIADVLCAEKCRYEILFVNDGSSDGTLEVLRRIKRADPHVGIVNLSRNFGKEIALTAGIDRARGDAVITIDADLQDPPEYIAQMIKMWREDGYDVVSGQYASRPNETLLKRLTSKGFYRLLNFLAGHKFPLDAGDFRLLSRKAVDGLKQVQERHRFMKGLFTWIGYKQTTMPYRRNARFAGVTKYNYWKLWNFSIEGITSFSTTPLKTATYFGLVIAFLAAVYAIVMITKTMIYGNDVPGYPSLIVVVLFIGGVQLIFLGIIGEYLARIFDEVKQRPLYLLQDYEPSSAEASVAGQEKIVIV